MDGNELARVSADSHFASAIIGRIGDKANLESWCGMQHRHRTTRTATPATMYVHETRGAFGVRSDFRRLYFWLALAVCAAVQPAILSAQYADPEATDALTTHASKLSSSEVRALELKAESDPNDLNAQEVLVTYYTLHEIKAKRLEYALKLIKNHPEAVIDCPYAQLSEQDSPIDSMAGFEQAKRLWLSYADSRTTEPQVLISAGLFIWQFDPNLAERLLLQGRELDPDNRQWKLALSDLYGKGIFMDGRFRPQTPPSPARHNFAIRARLVLAASKDPMIVGLAGLRLAPQDVEIVRTRSPEDLVLGEQLLRKAQKLAPADPQWGVYLKEFEAAKEEMAGGEPPPPDFGNAAPGTLVRRVRAEYPESAKKSGVTGVVQLRILVGVSGRVIVARPEEGPLELQAAAVDAVKRWIFKPFEFNGSPVEMWRAAAVSFP